MAHCHHVASFAMSAPTLIYGYCNCISLIPCGAGCKSLDIPRGILHQDPALLDLVSSTDDRREGR